MFQFVELTSSICIIYKILLINVDKNGRYIMDVSETSKTLMYRYTYAVCTLMHPQPMLC